MSSFVTQTQFIILAMLFVNFRSHNSHLGTFTARVRFLMVVKQYQKTIFMDDMPTMRREKSSKL